MFGKSVRELLTVPGFVVEVLGQSCRCQPEGEASDLARQSKATWAKALRVAKCRRTRRRERPGVAQIEDRRSLNVRGSRGGPGARAGRAFASRRRHR